jgi:hypothetical protein
LPRFVRSSARHSKSCFFRQPIQLLAWSIWVVGPINRFESPQ